MQYSGQGRVVKGIGKLNFSGTTTCKIIQGIVYLVAILKNLTYFNQLKM